jgi:hypothetical protein
MKFKCIDSHHYKTQETPKKYNFKVCSVEKQNRLSFADFPCELFAAKYSKRNEEQETPTVRHTQKTRGAKNHDVHSRRQLITTDRETTLGHKRKQLINLSSVFFCIQAVITHLVLLSCLISHLYIH